MISLDTRLMRMPAWFMDTPSETEMVVNGTEMPCPAATPRRAASACGPKDIEQGVFSPCWLTMPTMGLPKSSSDMPTARKKARWGVRSIPSTMRAEVSFSGGVKVRLGVGVVMPIFPMMLVNVQGLKMGCANWRTNAVKSCLKVWRSSFSASCRASAKDTSSGHAPNWASISGWGAN